MDEAPPHGSRQRWLALGLAVLGVAVLGWALWGFLRLTVSSRAPGFTAGGATTLAEQCSRSVPAELAQACIDAGQQKAAAAMRPLELAAALGGALVGLAISVGIRSRRHRPNHRRNG